MTLCFLAVTHLSHCNLLKEPFLCIIVSFGINLEGKAGIAYHLEAVMLTGESKGSDSGFLGSIPISVNELLSEFVKFPSCPYTPVCPPGKNLPRIHPSFITRLELIIIEDFEPLPLPIPQIRKTLGHKQNSVTSRYPYQ